MTPDQLDNDISELETRMERLRSLYEQYFMGIERTIPIIPKKDVERRVQELRKVRFQNTAKRFKFQTLIQRYNSLQQYWTRTCRDIENGTYRRHVQRAERRFGTDDFDGSKAGNSESGEAAPAEEQLDLRHKARASLENDLAQMMDADVDPAEALGAVLRDLEQAPAKKRDPAPSAGGLAALGRRSGAPEAQPTGTEARKPGLLAALGTRKTASTEPEAERPVAPPPPPAPARTQTGGGPPPAPSMRAKTPAVANVAEAKMQPPAAAAQKPAAQNPAARKPGAQSTEGLASLTPKRPVPTASENALSEERIRAIHQSYSQARAQTNATAVSYEKLAKSLRETEQKLREKTKGRQVEFDVTIQDGKAILKPKIK